MKMFANGSTLVTRPTQFTEEVSGGAMVRNDPYFKKLPATWSYVIIHREAFNNDENPEVPCHTIIRTVPPNPWMKSYGNTGVNIDDPVVSGLFADWDRNTVRNLALDRLNEKVRGGLDLSVSVFEARQTKRMLKSTAKLLNFARSQRPKGGYKHRLGSTKDVANGYLQFKYGWSPLLNDIFGIANESIRMHMNALQKYTASAKMPLKSTKLVLRAIDGVNCNAKRAMEGESRCRFAIWMKMPPTAFDLARFTSLNPISIGWELIPYSFVVDWVYDVGSYLRNVETAMLYGSQFVRGYTSEIFACETVETISGHSSTAFDGTIDKLDGMKAWNKYLQFQRTVLGSYPFPWRPSFKVDLSSDNLITSAALLRQLLDDAPKGTGGGGGGTIKRPR